jgi:formate hydrogenlyase transcriptional activator
LRNNPVLQAAGVLDGLNEEKLMPTAASAQPQSNRWLEENGPRELELLFRAITCNPCVPVLLADDDRHYRDVSLGAGKLLGLPREEIIGRQLDEFAEPGFRRQVPELWRDFLEQGEQDGTLRLVGPDGSLREVEYIAKGSVLPVRHAIVLRDKAHTEEGNGSANGIPSWLQDYALCLLDCKGCIAAWYAGAERIHGYRRAEVMGRHVSLLYARPGASPDSDILHFKLHEELLRAANEGHLGTESWQTKKDGSPFWANVVTMALRNPNGELQGFARVVRDFTECHERDETLQRNRARRRLPPAESSVAGIVFGEFESIPEANDVFLGLIGYTREDLAAGRLHWPDLTPPEYAALDGHAHEEALRFGACAPYEKELLGKDGTRVPVQVATAILKLSPFRWITFVQDLRERDRIENIQEMQVEVEQDFREMVGSSTALNRILRQVEVVAPTDATVLILGETGTGKELVARAIHRLSPRKDMACITLNCAAIPTGLLESELFGYERGAFTGALSQKIGRFEMANHGTLFLDEVGDIPLDLQPKLLRALQEKSFERLGGTRTIPIDVRLVAATNRNLAQMMGEKLFRSDLYYRLKVFPITVPPLRDRPDDIPILARHFTKKYSEKMNRQIDKIPADTMQALTNWHWPGNVRELENFIERAVILSRGPSLRAPLDEIRQDSAPAGGGATLEQIEREHIMRVFRESDGVVTTAATRLGLHRTTLNAMMRKLGISRHDL